jgi:hypothetical protein
VIRLHGFGLVAMMNMKNILDKCDYTERIAGGNRVKFTVSEGNRRKAIAISTGDSGETRLWVGTACGLSCYRY